MHIPAIDLGWFCVDVQSGGHAEFAIGQKDTTLNVHGSPECQCMPLAFDKGKKVTILISQTFFSSLEEATGNSYFSSCKLCANGHRIC